MNTWNPARYQSRHSYVFEYGESLTELLAPKAGESILDLGCGSGQLTAKIAERGANVIGIDRSPEMIAEARRNFSSIRFEVADATNFTFPEPFDAVFSNAVLHWVLDAEGAARSIATALKPAGRFVAELGGKGNVKSIIEASEVQNPWYYPSLGEYASLLERHGLEPIFATLFDRPTRVDGDDGLNDWLKMFGSVLFQNLDDGQIDHARLTVCERLRPKLFRDGGWTIDYRRLRVIAIKH